MKAAEEAKKAASGEDPASALNSAIEGIQNLIHGEEQPNHVELWNWWCMIYHMKFENQEFYIPIL